MMNQEDLFKKIGLILSELQEQYQFLAQNPQNLNELELELFLANANFLTDHIHIVKKARNAAAVKSLPEHTEYQEIAEEVKPAVEEVEEIKPVAQEEVFQPENTVEEVPEEIIAEPEPVVPVQQEKPAPVAVLNEEIFKLDKDPANFEFILNEHPSTDKFEFEEKEVGDIFDRPLSEEEQRIIAQKQKLREKKDEEIAQEDDELGPEPFLVPAEAEKEQEVSVQKNPEPVFPSAHQEELSNQQDLFKEEIPVVQKDPEPNTIPEASVKPTLNELLGGGLKTNSYTEPGKTEVTDLKQAISLNDKLLYIKDLFNGYNLAYAEVIDLLNKMPDFKTADTFLQNNYAVKNDWKSKQNTVDRFYELLNRRFPAK